MSALVTYSAEEGIATLTMDDGKVNVLSLEMLLEINSALDQAQADGAIVLLRGREAVFSAGFDLAVLRAGGSKAVTMVRAGFELAERVLAFPLPVVMACTGHAIAMGLFLLMSGDYRVGVGGPYKLTANEVALGITMPRAAIEILRQRMTPAPFNRAIMLAESFSTDDAVAAGLLDRIVEPAALGEVTYQAALEFTKLDQNAHTSSKLRARAQTLEALRAAIDADSAAFRSTT
jgi:enoyl-CoA hydratase